jgi:phosphatidylethanolamine/phosphatidyl-N-methylethanolamine N-methyltransferase
MDEKDDLVGAFYRDYYSATFEAGGVSGVSFSLTHKIVERRYQNSEYTVKQPSILEVGAGKCEHLGYVKDDFSKYVNLDLFQEPENFPGRFDERISWIQGDILDASNLTEQYDRVIVMCVLHHVHNPQKAIKNMLSKLKPGGTISIFLPSDPGFMNRLNRKLFIIPRTKRLGFHGYDLVNAREHHNHYWSLKKELNHQTVGYRGSVIHYPFFIPSASLSLFSVWTLTKPIG